MEIIVEVRKKPGENGLCAAYKISINEDDLLEIAEKKAVADGTFKNGECYYSEVLHIIP